MLHPATRVGKEKDLPVKVHQDVKGMIYGMVFNINLYIVLIKKVIVAFIGEYPVVIKVL